MKQTAAPHRPASTADLRRRFGARGVFVFVMTPFHTWRDRRGRLAVDLAGLEGNLTHFSRVPGDRAMVVCGGSGEFHSLSAAEVLAVAEAAVAGAGGRCQVVVGVGGPDATAVRMAEGAQAAGCDAVLVMPHPPVVQRGEAAVWARHRAIAGAIDIGMLPFRAPNQTLSPALVQRLARLPQVVAVKEESGAVDWVRTGALLTGGRVPMITGGSENMVPYYYLAGAVGFTSGMANLTLPQSIQLHDAALAGDWKAAMEWRDWFEPLSQMRSQLGNPMLKGGLEMMGLAGGPIRATGAMLDASGRRRVRRMLRAKGLL